MLADLRQRATLPSKKSNMSPASGSASADHRYASSFVRRYRADEKMEKVPQNPFMIVIRSARWKLLQELDQSRFRIHAPRGTHRTREKWPSSFAYWRSAAVCDSFSASVGLRCLISLMMRS
jgi:hypothetical protein